jgi:hypothetical protein
MPGTGVEATRISFATGSIPVYRPPGITPDKIFAGVKTINYCPANRRLKSTINSSSTKKSVQA